MILLILLAALITWSLTGYVAYKEFQKTGTITLAGALIILTFVVVGAIPVLNILSAVMAIVFFFDNYEDVVIFKRKKD